MYLDRSLREAELLQAIARVNRTGHGKSHRLMFSSSSDQFGCGYCRVKGGPGELDALATERKAARS
ncbi:hypothetical protein [Halomonas aquatica]|uniref:Uncharacterized protein n=1 Tax=Halomonas aquatica TaxID=3151123 RepID=A0ABV1NC62_9GAMM